MDDIDKRMENRYNLFNSDSINSAKEEKEKNRINLRKKNIHNIMMRKRYYDNYSHMYSNNNINKSNKTHNNIIDISLFLINDELKKEETVKKIIAENSFKNIFNYINEIYKDKNFQIDILKYGLFLLNEKLLKLIDENADGEDNEEDNSKVEIDKNKIIKELIENNIQDIIIKLLTFSYKEIKIKDNETIILSLAYQILVNYTYLSNEGHLDFLINENILKLHLYFLRFSSEEHNIINILRMFFNIFIIYKAPLLDKLLSFNNFELLNILNEYISSGINTKNYIILDKILDIYSEYLNSVYNDIDENKNFNVKIFEEIYEIVLQSVFSNNKNVFANCLNIIGNIYKICFISKNIDLLSKFILNSNTRKAIKFIMDFNYIDSPENIADFCKILCNIIKCESYCNNLNTKKQLENFIRDLNNGDMNDYEIIFIITNLIQKNYTNKIMTKLINVLIALCDSETFYINLFESYSNPILILINNINCPNYKLRRKVLTALEKITDKKELRISNQLVSNKIFNKLKYIIDPDCSFCGDESMIISSLNIIYNLLVVGDIIKSLGTKINNNLDSCEFYGGREMIEKLMNNKNKNIYDKALYIYNEYLNKNEINIE